jgi:hypothetical protein
MSYKLLMGTDQKMDWDFKFMVHYMKLGVAFYPTSTPKSFGKYREYTPYNKGNLWKIRYYLPSYFKVFYGTIEKAYCTTITDCLKVINNN